MDSANTNPAETVIVPQTMALARRDELAIARQQCGEAQKKSDNYRDGSGLAVFTGGLLGGFGGFATLLYAASVLHPVTAIIGGIIFLGGVTTSTMATRHKNKLEKAATAARKHIAVLEPAIIKEDAEIKTQTQTQRLAQLKTTAESEFDRVLEIFDLRAGMAFPLVSDTAPKILRIEQVEAEEFFKDGGFVPRTTVTAQLYDAHIGANGDPERDRPTPEIPILKRTIVSSAKALPR